MIRSEQSLEYHATPRPGKIELKATKPCLTPREVRMAYLPGACFPAREIANDPSAVFRYTTRGNLVGVVTNGTAVAAVGDVGPLAAKPMQEGVAVLFKRLADLDVFDLEIDAADPDRLVETVAALEPTFGAINLKDIRAPEGLQVYDRLRERLGIPVFHENLYSTAVVAMAGLVNALDLVDKRIESVRIVLCGAGTVGVGCARLLSRLGVPAENLLVYDAEGLLHPDREDLNPYQRPFARPSEARTLRAGLDGADVFLGASAGGVLTPDALRSMARYPIVFALATPEPEIDYDVARSCRRDVVVATALDEHPNAVVDLLSGPYVLRGALDVQATQITEDMLLAAAQALAELAREDVSDEVERAYGRQRLSFGPEYLLPKPIDARVLVREASAVAAAAVAEGVARRPLAQEAHESALDVRLGTGRETLREMMLRARRETLRVAFSEGDSEAVLRACSIIVDEHIASPVLIGATERVHQTAEMLGIDLAGMDTVDPGRGPRLDAYVEQYFRLRRRHGVIRVSAERKLREHDTFAAMMLHAGDVDMMVTGLATHYPDPLRTILQVIGPAPGIRRIASHYLVLLPRDVLLLADCAVNIDPDAHDLAEIALLSATTARALGMEPRVAMLSFSNYGSVEHPRARKVRSAVEIVRSQAPDLDVDGEMQPATALDTALRNETFPFAELRRDANVLIFPDLQSGNLALQLLQYRTEAVIIGPLLMGTRLPAHALQYGLHAEDIVHLTTLGVVEAAAIRQTSERWSLPDASAGPRIPAPPALARR